MAKILGSVSMNGNIPKLLELPDEYIINGQVYDKNSFSAKPLEFCPVPGTAGNESSFYKTLNLKSQDGFNRSDRNILIDTNDPSISYVATTAFNNAKITQFKRTPLGLEQQSIEPYDGFIAYDFIGQNQDRVFVLANITYSSRVSYIFAINKNTMRTELTSSLGSYTRASLIRDTPNFVYLAVAPNENRVIIYKYNKTSGALTPLLDDNRTGYIVVSRLTKPIKKDNSYLFYTAADGIYKDNVTNHELCFRRYTMEGTTEVTNVMDVNLDLSILKSNKMPLITNSSKGISYELLTHSDGLSQYVTLVVTNCGDTNYLSHEKCMLFTFEIKKSTVEEDAKQNKEEWELISYKFFTPILYRGLLPMFNNNLLLLANEDGISFYAWNSGNRAFEVTTQYAMPVSLVGMDMNNNIWIQQVDKSLDILSNTLPVEIYADFEKNEYEYDSSPISTNVELFARNYSGKYLGTSLELSLIGPVTFAEDGSKKKTITTTSTGKMDVPVIVNGSGMLSVNVKVL